MPSSTPTRIPPASRSATTRSQPCQSHATASTATGTTPPPPASDGRGDDRQQLRPSPGEQSAPPHAAFAAGPRTDRDAPPTTQRTHRRPAPLHWRFNVSTCSGHERLVASGTGAKAKRAPVDRVLLAVLHLRKLATMDLLGQLFGTAMTISRANQEVHPRPSVGNPNLLDGPTALVQLAGGRSRSPPQLECHGTDTPPALGDDPGHHR